MPSFGANVRNVLPVATSQIRIVLSWLPVAAQVPSGEQTRRSIPDVWPVHREVCRPVNGSQTRTVLSVYAAPVISDFPSGVKVGHHTWYVWPKSWTYAPVAT